MPRWEDSAVGFRAGDREIEITGIVNEWLNNQLPNLGILLVYERFPSEYRQVVVKRILELNVEYIGPTN